MPQCILSKWFVICHLPDKILCLYLYVLFLFFLAKLKLLKVQSQFLSLGVGLEVFTLEM